MPIEHKRTSLKQSRVNNAHQVRTAVICISHSALLFRSRHSATAFVPPEEDSVGVFAFAFAHLSRRSLSYGVSTYVARLGPHREKSSRGQYFTVTIVKMERSYYNAVLFI